MADRETRLTELWDLVRSVPKGRVVGYGSLGRALSHPVSGFLVGKWMAQCPADVPWWRVVGSKGDLLLAKRDPSMALEQQRRLEAEGCTLIEGVVPRDRFFDLP